MKRTTTIVRPLVIKTTCARWPGIPRPVSWRLGSIATVVGLFKQHHAFDAEGIFIGDATYLFVPQPTLRTFLTTAV
jgi:hypothetical protein